MGRLVSAARDGGTPTRFLPSFTVSSKSVHALNADGRRNEPPIDSKPGDDSYVERVAKYVPIEIVSFITASINLLGTKQTIECHESSATCFVQTYFDGILLFVLAVGLIATPIYIWQQRNQNQPWGLHAVMSTIAYLIWTYNIHLSISDDLKVFSPAIAGLLVLIFTLFSGFIIPSKPKESSPASNSVPAPAGE